MKEWQKLIQALVEIWTDEDIKNGKWEFAQMDSSLIEPKEQENHNDEENQRKSA